MCKYRPIVVILAAVVVMVAMAGLSWAQEAEVAWVQDFETPDSPQGARIFYEPRKSGQSGDHLIVREVENGVLRYGMKYEAGRAGDRLSMLWGKHQWWQGITTEWGPFDLKQYPLLEICWRGDVPEVWFATTSETGDLKSNYTFPSYWPTRTLADEQGREWKVSVFRVAPDSSVPSPYTPRKLWGINICLFMDSEKAPVTEIDYIRVRGLTAQEQEREQNVVRIFEDFPRPQWPEADSFFPFGVYGAGYLRGDFEYWGGGYEGAYATMARHHLNMVASNDEVELGRFGHDASAVESYINQMKGLIEAAQATGVRLAADVRRMMEGRQVDEGYEQLLPITRRLAEAFGGEKTICAWAIADEAGQGALPNLLAITRALNETDPDHRPALAVFNASTKFASYSPYLSINYWDEYPVREGSRNPWRIRTLAQAYRQIAPDMPMWGVLQAFETRPPTAQGSYMRPSDAEMRLMTYLALAEGADGLIYFNWYCGHGQLENMVTRSGQPHGGMLDTLADLGETLIPIGELLLKTKAPSPAVRASNEPNEAGVTITEKIPPTEEHGLAVNVLAHRSRPVNYLVVVNEDLSRPRTGQITLSPKLLAEGQRVYDLYILEEVSSVASLRQESFTWADRSFTVDTLAGGDGRVYLVGSPEEFARDRQQIQVSQAREAVRVLTPDITVARRWDVNLAEVDEALAACQDAVQAGQAEEALAQAQRAEEALRTAIAGDSLLHMTGKALQDMKMELAELSRVAEHPSTTPRWWTGRDHPMMVPNPDFLDLSKEYWRVGRSYRDLYKRYLAGEKEGLWGDLHQTRTDLLQLRDSLLGYLREHLAPAHEPVPEEG